ncbi:MAG: hypothetical protein WC026_16865 [Hyphomicrobium sp.]|uniref:hypothetical protein n=1 Tax=Hyphomicrobium sp. TaxID=82 RepID=UPI003567E479
MPRETIKSLKAQIAKLKREQAELVEDAKHMRTAETRELRERNARQAAQIDEQVATIAAKDKRINELLTASNTNETAARAARAECVALQARLTEATRIMATLGARPPLTFDLREGR